MAIWSSEKIKAALAKDKLIEPFDENAVKHGAYELALGPEAFLTSSADKKKTILCDGDQIVIPPGQFGLLLTEERVRIPNSVLANISIKAGIKFRGLVNVSGFHVDPGFPGRLKFSVYNAGSQNIVLQRKQRVFLLWFSDLDQPTADVYKGSHANQDEITPDDVMKLQGEIASPGQLKDDINKLETGIEARLKDVEHKCETRTKDLGHKVDKLIWIASAIFGVLLGLLGFTIRGCIEKSDSQVKSHFATSNNASTAAVTPAFLVNPTNAQR
jgi:dCTP deaminase